MHLKFTIYGDPRTKKNSMQIIKLGNRYSLTQNARYKAYEREFINQAMEIGVYNKNLSKTLEITCTYYRQTKRLVDLTNLLACTDDCLVKAKIITDDNYKVIVSHDGSRIKFDKRNPRVEIEIKEIDIDMEEFE